MRAKVMRVGEQYEMQRGPTRTPRRVTLLDRQAPSGRQNWVKVRIEDGMSTGKVMEAPCRSIRYLPGKEPAHRKGTFKTVPKPVVEAPPGWRPRRGEAVAWTQTLGSRFQVLGFDPKRGMTRIKGKVMGMEEEYEAPMIELAPFTQQLVVVPDAELESRLKGRLPEKVRAQGADEQPKPKPVHGKGRNHELVWRLVFTPECVEAYRSRFARGVGLGEAERRLREELNGAERVRTHPKEYLRLQVKGRFEVPLKKRPMPLKPTRIDRLVFAVKPMRRKKPLRRRAA